MPPMFLPSGMVAMARTFGPKPDVVIGERVAAFLKANPAMVPDSLHITVTQGVGAVSPEENQIWQDAFLRVLLTVAASEKGAGNAA